MLDVARMICWSTRSHATPDVSTRTYIKHPLGENQTTSWESPLISIIKMVGMSTKLLEMECKYWILNIMELYCTVKTYSCTCTLWNIHTSHQKMKWNPLIVSIRTPKAVEFTTPLKFSICLEAVGSLVPVGSLELLSVSSQVSIIFYSMDGIVLDVNP